MAPPKQFVITPEVLREMHYERLMSPPEIAKEFGCDIALIYHYFHKFGIEKRPKNQNLLEKRFGRLTVIRFLGISNREARWLCQCDCGNSVESTTGRLNFGTTQSCGCFNRDQTSTHRMSHTRPYRIWFGMRSRCDNLNEPTYEYYGKRGIRYCDAWSTFEGFWKDMQSGYTPDKTLDRIDNDGNYCPENCRWATYAEQNQHKSTTSWITYKGQTLNITQWAEKLGVSRSMLYGRKKLGWSDQEIIETPRRSW